MLNMQKVIKNENYTNKIIKEIDLMKIYVNVISFNVLVLVINFCPPLLDMFKHR